MKRMNNRRNMERKVFVRTKSNGLISYIAYINGFNSEMKACSNPNHVTPASNIFKIVR